MLKLTHVFVHEDSVAAAALLLPALLLVVINDDDDVMGFCFFLQVKIKGTFSNLSRGVSCFV